jgi:hypothetical protein
MTVTTNDVKNRLEKGFQRLDFTSEDAKKISTILAKASDDVSPSDWAKSCIKSTKPPKDAQAKRGPTVSPQYFYALKSIAEDKGWVEKLENGTVKLTISGERIIQFLNQPVGSEIEFTVDRGAKPGKIRISFEDGGLKNHIKLRRLLRSFLKNYAFRKFLGLNLAEILDKRRVLEGKLTISYEDIHEDPDVIRLFNSMLRFYFRVCRIPEEEIERLCPLSFITPGIFDDPKSGHWSWNYYNYWAKMERKALDEKDGKWQAMFKETGVVKKVFSREEFERKQKFFKKWRKSSKARIDIEKYAPKWLIEAVKKAAVRSWIERRLNETPNFFMPFMFWEELGFGEIIEKKAEEKPLGAYPHCSHPYDTRLTGPKFGEFLEDMEKRFIFAKIVACHRNKEDAFREIYYGVRDCWDKPGFYEAWELLRKILELKDLDVFAPLDRAFIRWVGGRSVNLAEVYGDLKDGKRTLAEAVEDIQNALYDSG